MDDTDVFADVELQQKDLVLAQELARRLGMAVPNCAATSEMLDTARSSEQSGPRLRRERPCRLPPHGGDGLMAGPYRTRIDEVPLERGLREDEGWIDMQVQFLIDERTAGSETLVVGRTVLPPGARHERHRHPNCNEFLVVMSGRGRSTPTRARSRRAGDVVFTPAGTGTASTTHRTRTCS